MKTPKHGVCCRNCSFFPIERVKNKAGAVMRDRGAQCQWKSTEVYPFSVNGWMGNGRPTAGWVQADQGQDCKCFVLRPTF